MSIIAKLYSALFAPASHLEDMSKHIEDAERTTWNNANSNINAHSIDSVVHVTAEQKNIWDAKQDAIPEGTYDAYGSANLVNESLNAHTYNGDIHVTLEDKQRWELKQDAISSDTYDFYGAADTVQYNLINHENDTAKHLQQSDITKLASFDTLESNFNSHQENTDIHLSTNMVLVTESGIGVMRIDSDDAWLSHDANLAEGFVATDQTVFYRIWSDGKLELFGSIKGPLPSTGHSYHHFVEFYKEDGTTRFMFNDTSYMVQLQHCGDNSEQTFQSYPPLVDSKFYDCFKFSAPSELSGDTEEIDFHVIGIKQP